MSATSARRGMVPRDLTRIHFVGEPKVSPDGRRVAFTVTTLSEERDEYLSNIWLVDLAGGEPRRLTTGPKRDRSPRWSPDGQRLAFLSERADDKRPQLYVLRLDGGEPLRLSTLKDGAADPEWSPDGSQLLFTSRTGGPEEPTDEAEKARSKPARVISTLKYKYNGQGFVYDRRRHVFVVDAEGGESRQVTAGDYDNAAPVWSPDGRSIAFVSARHADRDCDDVSDVWLVPAESGEPRRLTGSDGPCAEPSFSPDGRRIAYFHTPHVNAPGRNDRVYVLDVAAGQARSLTDDLDRTCGAGLGRPLWAPDGGGPFFGAMDRGSVPLFGPNGTRVVGGERQLQGYDLTPDGRGAVFAAVDPVSPSELYVADVDSRGERQLTDFNGAWKAGMDLPRPERLTFERDGFPVDVWVMRPAGFVEGQRYPVLLNMHGGPHAQYGYAFFDEFQVYAGAGFAVVYCNPRGSQGYGEAFATAVIGDFGGGDYADVMTALDHALASFDFLDPERLGIMGGSYGGYMTSWTIAHTNRFKAACSERALNSWRSFVGSSDIGFFFPEAESGGRPWDDVQWQNAHSPLTYARNIETPLLIMHAEDDLRCPIEQAEELFVALKLQRKDVLFVRFPDENHEMSRSGKPRHRLARFGFILDWFARRL